MAHWNAKQETRIPASDVDLAELHGGLQPEILRTKKQQEEAAKKGDLEVVQQLHLRLMTLRYLQSGTGAQEIQFMKELRAHKGAASRARKTAAEELAERIASEENPVG